MTVQFITGPAGSGKTTYVMQQVSDTLKINNQKKIIILVPEQASFCYQYELITQYSMPGVMTLEVLSFQRLARTIMQQSGGLARQNIDDLGKLLVMRRMIQESSEQYPYFSQSINRSGYLTKLGDTIQELKRYCISPDLLYSTLKSNQNNGSLLGSKLEELSALYTSYEAFLAQSYIDSEDALNILIKQLEYTAYLQNTEIWVDEFYDFTPQELIVLGKLMHCAESVHIVLPIDHNTNHPGRKAVFHHTEKIYQKLSLLAMKHGVEVLPDCVFSETARWKQCDELAFLEQQYFCMDGKNYDYEPSNVALIECQNRMSEVDYAARTIRNLCREEGYRYSDIAIFTRGEQYTHILETVFVDYDIPYFVDHKETVHQHPLTELILSIFEIVQNHWSYQSVFHMLKTGLLPFAQHEIDILENYVLQYGIRGNAWYRDENWQYPISNIASENQEERLLYLNDFRKRIAGPIYAFQIAVEEPQKASGFIQALYHLLDQYEIAAKLESLCNEAIACELLEQAQVHQQIWNKLIHIFDQMTNLLQDTFLTVEEFSVILQAAVQNLDLGLIPSSLDQVFIGSLAHSRARNLKAVFVLGLNEGVFPAKIVQTGFFSDNEKHQLQEWGIQLAHDSAETIHDEQFLIYLALTRASEKLFLSYALSDDEGKALRPSVIVDRLHRLFPRLTAQFAQWPPDDHQEVIAYLNHRQKALGLLGGYLNNSNSSKEETVWSDLYRWFLNHPDEKFIWFQNNLKMTDSVSSRSLSHAELFGSPLNLSVSALETYRKCPYRYFLTYGLRLQERKLYQIEAIDTGTFYHAAIEAFSSYLLEHNLSWESLDAESVKRIMKQIVDHLAPQLQHQILMSSGRYQYIRFKLEKTLEKTALLLMEHGKRGAFVPIALEVDFGGANSKIPGYHMILKDGTSMYLQGKIDRIEHAAANNSSYLRVIDFKSGKQGLDLTEVYYGLKIQLLTYLSVAMKYYETLMPEDTILLPAGVLYYFFKNEILSAEGPVKAEEAELMHQKAVRADGLLLADMNALKLADNQLDVGNSTLLPVNLLSKAAPYIDNPEEYARLNDPMELFGKRNHTVVSKEQMLLLMEYVQKMILDFGEEIHKGNIAVQPCRLRQFSSCQYCNYQAICHIQTLDFNSACMDLPPLSKEEIWSKLEMEHNTAIQESTGKE